MNSGITAAQLRVDELRAEFEALETLILRRAGSEADDVRSDEVFVELGAAERELARLSGKPYVIDVIDCKGLPPPIVGSADAPKIQAHGRLTLKYNSFAGRVTVIFEGCIHLRMGRPGFELQQRSQYWSAGLKSLQFVEVVNSQLLSDLVNQERGSEDFDPTVFEGQRHFLL